MTQKQSSIFDRLAPVFLVGLVGMAFGLGVLWQKVNYLEKGGTAGTTTTTTAGDTVTADQPAGKASLDDIKKLFGQDLVKFGDAKRKVLFVEAGDPSCPYCHIAAGKNPSLNNQADPGGRFKLVSDGGTYVAPVEEMRKLVDSGKASFVFLYTPGHGNGEMGTKAMYCAHEKGKFWQVHDLLMTSEGYDLLNNEVKNDKAQAGKLADFLKSAVDSNFLKGCLEGGKYDSRLTEETTLARSLGFSGTPGFYVNETLYAGAYSFKDMEATVNSALQ